MLTLQACKGKETRDPDAQYACERDLERINDPRPCSQNEDCPCGTHCLSGLCAYECLEDIDCDGWCDYFGRCRAADDTDLIPEISASSGNDVFSVEPKAIDWQEWSPERTVRIRALAGDMSDVRVKASGGLTVSCGSGFADECLIASIAGGETAEVGLRIEGPLGEEDSPILEVYHGLRYETVGITAGSPPLRTAAEPGVYDGQIWINETSALITGNEPAQEIPVSVRSTLLRVGVEIRIYNDGTVVFTDEVGLLPESMVFRVDGDGHFSAFDGDEDLSRQVFIGDAESTDDEGAAEVAVSMAGDLRVVNDVLSGSLAMILSGLGETVVPLMLVDERLHVGWQFNAMRSGDIPSGEDPPPPGGGRSPVFDDTFDRYAHMLPWERAVVECNDLNWGAAGLAERIAHYLCYAHNGTMDSVPLSADPGDLTKLGDLKCDEALLRRTVLPLFTNADTASGGLQAQAMLGACKSELDYLRGDVPATTLVDAEGLDFLSGCGADGCDDAELPECVDGPLAMRTLGLGTESLARTGWPDMVYWDVVDPDALRLAHRILQNWIQTGTFVAREQAQSADFLFGASAADLESGLDASLEVWNILLHPRVAGWLLHLPPDMLAAPDYRGEDFATESISEDRTQRVGLPVIILEGLRAQLEAAAVLVNRARYENTGASDRVTETLHYAAVIIPVAELLYSRARSAGELPWQARWQEARTSFRSALKKLQEEIEALESGVNPLGIGDEDLPLYYGPSSPTDPGERFSAISSHLINDWAGAAVARAENLYDEASAAYSALLERQLQKEIMDEGPDRQDEIRGLYGEKIINLCGDPNGDGTENVLEGWTDLSGSGCFMNPTMTQCLWDEEELLSKLTVDDVAYQLCLLTEYRMTFGDRAKVNNDFLNDVVDDLQAQVDALYTEGDSWWRMDFMGFGEYAVDVYNAIFDPGQCELADAMDFSDFQISENADALALANTERTCRAQVPNGTSIPSMMTSVESSPLDRPECYQGSLGELALASRAAGKEIEVANSELQDSLDAYQNRLNHCIINEQALEGIEAVSSQLSALTGKLDTYMGMVNSTAEICNSVVDTFSLSFSLGTGKDAKPPGLGIDPAPLMKLITGKITEATGAAVGIDEIKGMHADFLEEYTTMIRNAQCFNDAELYLVDADTRAREIERARLDLALALVKLHNGQAELDRLVTEGRRRLAGEIERDHTSLVNDIWNDLYELEQAAARGKMDEYRRQMKLAQLTVYLAVRAVEYEFQMTHTIRADVLRAVTPTELLTAVDRLRAEIGTVSIAGQSPESLHVVFSLKDQLKQLADMQDWPLGEHKFSDTQRFRMLLSSPKYAHYDNEGVYQGQLIPFSLAPLGVLGLGEPGTIALLAGSDCAERIWSVNLVIQGDDLVDDESTYTRVDLLQRNTFFSQWCVEPGDDLPPVQVSSVRPSHNLFKDPIWGADYGESDTTQSDFTRTRIEAYFNIDRAEFEAEDYQQGAKEELATRAIYGEYALFFPVDFLAVDGSSGLHLKRIDDILLRIDYVSAAKAW